MGRVKTPRCDNCGAPVELAQGATETRCEYCNEVLIREPAPPPAPPPYRPPPGPPPPAPVAPRATVAPFLIAGVATLAIGGASAVANLLTRLQPLPRPAAAPETPAVAAPMRAEREASSPRKSETRSEEPERSKTAEATTARSRKLARPPASAAPAAPGAPPLPPKLPPFNTSAAVAGLDAAKVKAEATCRGTAGVRLFVQMGFDADGVNRGAALSDAKLKATPEAKCALRIFRAVRIPAFDMATRPSGLGRPVKL